ncbi:MAG: histidine phosphatase family protein [Betaproteobacteria bacterium]|nr:histidine phosphatase family protein [Betaproteobacteria bacterium]
MELILWRHADAEPGRDDAKRALTDKGKKQAAKVAKWLKPRIDDKWLILASPTVRTRETVDALGMKYETRLTLGPDSSASAILREAHWPDGDQNVVVVSHQPILGHIASRLITGHPGDMNIRKGSVWWFSTRMVDDDEAGIILRAMIGADLVDD